MRGAYVCTWAVLALCLCAQSTARAYHTDEQRIISGTAFTLRRNEWQVGLFRADYGIIPELQVGTYILPWFSVVPNLQVKGRVFHNERFSVALRPGFFYVDLSMPRRIYGFEFGGADARIWAIPLEAYMSMIMRERFTLTWQAAYTIVTGSGSYDEDDYRGTATSSNAQVGSVFEWRINRIAALLLQGRLMLYQSTSGAGEAEVELDERTVARVKASADANPRDALRIFSVSASVVLSWRHGNLRIGAGYGNYNIPGLNMVVGELYPFPVFDFYFRF